MATLKGLNRILAPNEGHLRTSARRPHGRRTGLPTTARPASKSRQRMDVREAPGLKTAMCSPKVRDRSLGGRR